jgi:hypothetical protein
MANFDDLRGVEPLVINSRKKKNKRKYSRGMSEFQTTAGRLTRIGERLARSSTKGMKTFRKESKASAGRKRDGAVKDLGLNMARGIGASLEASRPIPEDIAKTLSTKSQRKVMRRQLKVAAKLSRSLGLK